MNEEVIQVFLEVLVVPFVYMACYFVFAKEVSFKGSISAISNAVALYFSGCVSVLITKTVFNSFFELSSGERVILSLVSVLFSIPFFAGLSKSLKSDFGLLIFDIIEGNANLIIKYIAFLTVIGLVEFLCIASFLAGEGGIEMILFAVCFLFALVLVIKRGLQELAQIELKISDKFIATGIIISLMLLFAYLIFFK